MTQILRISLLGNVQIKFGDRPIGGLPSRTAEALLIYLLYQDQPVSREKLAELLWADRTQSQAMKNLRTILSALKRELGDYLDITRQSLAFNHKVGYECDALAFETRLQALFPQVDRGTILNPDEAQRLQSVLDLFQGEFLEGFYLRDGRGFEEWVVLTRERLHRLARQGFRRLAQHFLEINRYDLGLRYADLWSRIDPYDEDACRTMMWLLTRSGQRNAALQHFKGMKTKLKTALDVLPTGKTTELAEYIQTLELPPPVTLPTMLSAFVGRETEIEQLRNHLSSPNTHILSIVGPGGVGKTRLTVEAARRIIADNPGQFLDGIFFIPLETVESARLVPVRIAEAIGFSFQGQESIGKQLLGHLLRREMLLILDNYEQLLDLAGQGITFLVELIHQAPGIKVLVTSRERMNLYEEIVYDLSGFATPALDPVMARQSAAVTLFVQNARKSDRHFDPTPGEIDCIREACRMVHGLPLAIELAASWRRRYSCSEIVDQITESIDFLQSNYRNIPERHSSMRAIFEHSWRLLDARDRQLFAQLSLFQGGFAPEAVEVVIGDKPARDGLVSLAEKSLVNKLPGNRFDIHPLLKAYAAERLQEFPDLKKRAAERYAAFFMDFLRAQPDGESLESRNAITSEQSNIRKAWLETARTGDLTAIDAAAAKFHGFYSAQSWFQEGIDIFQETLEAVAARPEDPQQTALTRCDLAGRKARMEIHIGQLDAAREDLQFVFDTLADVDDPQRKSTVLGYMAITQFYAGEYQRALELSQETRRLADIADDRDGVAFALNFMGSCSKAMGRYEDAQQQFEDSVGIYRELGDEMGAAMTINNLGNVAQATGDYEAAQEYYLDCSAIFKKLDHDHGAATTLSNAGRLATRRGDYYQARELLAESLQLKEKINDSRGAAVALVALGDVNTRLGEKCLAKDQLTKALELASASGDIALVLDALVVIAAWLMAENRTIDANRILMYASVHDATTQETRERIDDLLMVVGEAGIDEFSRSLDLIDDVVPIVLSGM